MTADTRYRLAAIATDVMLNDGPEDTVYDVAVRIADRLIAAGFGDVTGLTAEVARLRVALNAVADMRLPDGTPCYCLNPHGEPHDHYCALARAALDPEREP